MNCVKKITCLVSISLSFSLFSLSASLFPLSHLLAVSLLVDPASVCNRMDPLGARSQFIDIQTLPTWQQQLDEDVKETPLNQSESLLGQEAFPSPFPIRADINRKIILL